MNIRYAFAALMCTVTLLVTAQTKTYELKKGEALDVLLLNLVPESNEALANYFKTVYPIGKAYGYRPQKGFKVQQTPTQGNYWPSDVIIGQWSDFDRRVAFIEDIEKEIPEFHAMRRSIWSTFFLTYWEIKEDQTLEVDTQRFNVLTAYWALEKEPFEDFKDDWIERVDQTDGQTLLELTDGISPLGYYYNPDYLTITSWESKEAFEQFNAKNLAMDHTGVKHVNQFIIE